MAVSFSTAACASTGSPLAYALYSRSYCPVALSGRLSKLPPSSFQFLNVSIHASTAFTCFFRFV